MLLLLLPVVTKLLVRVLAKVSAKWAVLRSRKATLLLFLPLLPESPRGRPSALPDRLKPVDLSRTKSGLTVMVFAGATGAKK